LKTTELLNYSRAAEELLIARQSLRQSVGALGEEIGKLLFIKTKNHLSLTEYGE
jgi:DNA-binding transcriptional LysR family regulator